MTEAYKAVPLSPLRKIIAARMTEAKQSIPHYRVSLNIELDCLLSFRQKLLANNGGIKISLNDLIIKACANTLMDMPALNCQLFDQQIHYFSQADISVVTAVEGGLSTPVIRGANTKTLEDIAGEVKSLAARAGSGQLKLDEITGGSFSISNLGMYGLDQFDAIINSPQCAILAIGAAKPQAVVKGGEISIATMMMATLSLDHRAIDGAQGAEFLCHLRDYLQRPESLL